MGELHEDTTGGERFRAASSLEAAADKPARLPFPDPTTLEKVSREVFFFDPKYKGKFVDFEGTGTVAYRHNPEATETVNANGVDTMFDQAMVEIGAAIVTPGFELEPALVQAMETGPVIEVAGPTREGYDLLNSFAAMPEGVYKSNIESAPASYEGTTELSYIADATQLPHADESIGVALYSNIGGGTDKRDAQETQKNVLPEISRVLKPGGLLIAQGVLAEDFVNIDKTGLEPRMVRVKTAQKTAAGERVSFSVVLQKV